VKVWGIVALVEADGWRLHSTRGSHRQYKHPDKPGRVTIPGKMRDDVHPKLEKSILRQAGIER
jgi:predicted RNA binding protein YcfA (HicA-like mRNA interferase family)